VIVTRTRRWAVAEWLIEEGLDSSLLDAEYRPEPSSGLGISRPELQSLLSKVDPERAEELAHVYLDPISLRTVVGRTFPINRLILFNK
jgi:hypothetical protein